MENEETIDHVVTQEDLDNNPELAEKGVNVGDTIQISKPKDETPSTTVDDGKMTEAEFIAKFKEEGFEMFKTEGVKNSLEVKDTIIDGLKKEIEDLKIPTPQASLNPNSVGAKRVRMNFNPGANPLVEKIKLQAATMINTLEDLKGHHPTNGEFQRCIAKAQTEAEDAAMWGVKAATFEG